MRVLKFGRAMVIVSMFMSGFIVQSQEMGLDLGSYSIPTRELEKVELENVDFNIKPTNPMGFTVYQASVGKESDLWMKAANLLVKKESKRNEVEKLQYDFFRYICFKARLEKAQILKLSKSSLNAALCGRVIGEEMADSGTINQLKRSLILSASKLKTSQAISFTDDLAGVYNEAIMFRFSEDPGFLMNEVSGLLEGIYDQDPLLFEKRKDDENKDAWDYAGDAADVGLAITAGVTGHRLVNNVLFNQILQGGARLGPTSMMSLWLRKGAAQAGLGSPVSPHTWETRVVNGKPKRVLKYEDPDMNARAAKCASFFAQLARNLAILGVWGASYYGFLNDEVEEFMLARAKVSGDSHPLDAISRAQGSVVTQLYQQIEAQRQAFLDATEAAKGGKESWSVFVDNMIIEEKMFLGTADLKPGLTEEQNISLLRTAITEQERANIRNRFFALAQAWAMPDNTSLVQKTAGEVDSGLRVSPSTIAKHRELLNEIKADAKQTEVKQVGRYQRLANEQVDVEKAEPVNLNLTIGTADTLLIGDDEGFPSINTLANGFVKAYTSNIGFE
ncbi:hypothetical protein GW915_08105 [bacterium]|nr:hypothetical protein [bacterium]